MPGSLRNIAFILLLYTSIAKCQVSDQPITTPYLWPWKGINVLCSIDKEITEGDIKKIAEERLNMVHILLNPPKNHKWDKLPSEKVFEIIISKTEEVLTYCKKYNLTAIVSFHKFPWNSNAAYNQTSKYFWEDSCKVNESLRFFELGVNRLSKHGKELAAYEFISEPIIRDANGDIVKVPANIVEVQQKCIGIIKRNDNGRYFCVSPGPGGHPSGYKHYKPFDYNRVIYNFHFFVPHDYTHQGIKNSSSYGYPGFIRFRYWDRKRILKSLEPVLKWKLKYNKLILMGSFGVVYWAEGREKFLRDLLGIAVLNGISYSYHCYNGYYGWSLQENKNEIESIKKSNSNNVKYQSINKKRVIDRTWQLLNYNYTTIPW